MQEYFEIKSYSGNYLVKIGHNILNNILKQYQDSIIICDEALVEKYLTSANNKIIKIKAEENAKDLKNISLVITQLQKKSLKRNGLIVAIGGGVIQDIACFVSSIYMRGVKWIYLPTTFLGMADSCIGGKSSINVTGVKNLVGNIYPPQAIYIDSNFINSLSKEQIVAGCCEAIKICYAYPNKEIFKNCCKLLNDKLEINNLSKIIDLSLKSKKWFIQTDEFDVKERQLLNFGHTFGHAIEGSCQYKIPHGIAVGFGMIWSIYFAEKYFGFNSNSVYCITQLKEQLNFLLSNSFKFYKIASKLEYNILLNKFNSDKKHQKDHYVCILPSKSGNLIRVQIPKTKEYYEMLKESFESFLGNIIQFIQNNEI